MELSVSLFTRYILLIRHEYIEIFTNYEGNNAWNYEIETVYYV